MNEELLVLNLKKSCLTVEVTGLIISVSSWNPKYKPSFHIGQNLLSDIVVIKEISKQNIDLKCYYLEIKTEIILIKYKIVNLSELKEIMDFINLFTVAYSETRYVSELSF